MGGGERGVFSSEPYPPIHWRDPTKNTRGLEKNRPMKRLRGIPKQSFFSFFPPLHFYSVFFLWQHLVFVVSTDAHNWGRKHLLPLLSTGGKSENKTSSLRRVAKMLRDFYPVAAKSTKDFKTRWPDCAMFGTIGTFISF